MALSDEMAKSTVKSLLTMRDGEQGRLERIASYVRGDHDSVYIPEHYSREYKWLYDRSTVNILPLIISVLSQNLYVDGYRPDKVDDNSDAWGFWQQNKMDSGQHGIHRAALKYGISYALVLPGDTGPSITPLSPRRMTAFYGDFNNDEWPLYAVDEVIEPYKKKDGKLAYRARVRLFDDESVYYFVSDKNRRSVVLEEVKNHGLGVCPVVRYLNEIDLDEDQAVAGEIEPLIDIQDQINSTTFDLLMAQQYAAFPQRYATGLTTTDEQGREIPPAHVGVKRLLTSDSKDTKFGEFSQADLGGYLKSREESVRLLSTISQFPPAYLLGSMVNISAEGMAAARDGLDAKVSERKSSFGESHEQLFRLCGRVSGDVKAWEDKSAQVIWRDTSPRSLSQTVDALGKMVQMLQVPPQVLWSKLPGVSEQDGKYWAEVSAKTDAFKQLQNSIDSSAGVADVQVPPVGG